MIKNRDQVIKEFFEGMIVDTGLGKEKKKMKLNKQGVETLATTQKTGETETKDGKPEGQNSSSEEDKEDEKHKKEDSTDEEDLPKDLEKEFYYRI